MRLPYSPRIALAFRLPPFLPPPSLSSLQVVCEDVAAAVMVQAPYEEDPDTRAMFSLSISPPDPCNLPVREGGREGVGG